MLEAFRFFFHRSGYHPRLTLGAARTTDRQELWTRCFPHAHYRSKPASKLEAQLCPEGGDVIGTELR